MRRSRWSRTLVVLLLVASVVTLVGAGSALAEPPERVKVLIGFAQQPGPAEQALVHRAGATIKYTYHLVPAIAASIPEAAIEGLRRNPNVTNVDLDLEVYAVGQVLPWGIDRIDAEAVHAVGNKGTGVMVAILDTGIDKDHPDLVANIKGGINFAAGPKGRWDDDNGHGTHVAGTIAAVDNEIGVIGVAPEAHLYAVKVLDRRGGGSYSDIIAGLQWAVDNGMQVTNNSYASGVLYPGDTVKTAFDNAYGAGILHVCAAGNIGSSDGTGDNVEYPAKFESCIAVAATDVLDNRASFSTTGPDDELAAPVVNILSSVLGGGYEDDWWDGTSMASPHVAGTAALVIASGITGAANVRQQLINTAEDLGDAGWDSWYGYGLVDAEAAAASPAVPNDPPVADADGPYAGTEDGAITFDGSGSSDPEGEPLTYKWDFGDGTQVTVDTPKTTHTYTTGQAGVDEIYDVTLVVNDGKVDSDPATTTATVTGVNDLPEADADGPYSGVVGEAITFDASGSSDEEGIATYTWDFGDGTVEIVATSITIHTYTTKGIYAVTLTVTDGDGAPATHITTAEVTEVPAYPAMHIASIDMSLKVAGPNRTAIATVTIVDADGDPVEGATVYGQWSGLTSDSDSGVTDASGKVALSSDRVRNVSGTFTFTVTEVTKEGWTYDASANVEKTDSTTAS